LGGGALRARGKCQQCDRCAAARGAMNHLEKGPESLSLARKPFDQNQVIWYISFQE
jgi:hypothetical protein